MVFESAFTSFCPERSFSGVKYLCYKIMEIFVPQEDSGIVLSGCNYKNKHAFFAGLILSASLLFYDLKNVLCN